jgi:ABC-type bacteriocin/lantibiotic exporter with double-glycine peptidase domain
MNTHNERSIGQILSEGVNDFIRIGAELVQAMLRLPVPALLLTCLLLAIFLTILPLALTLFVIFLIIKLIVAIVSPKQQHQQTDDV